MTAIYQYWHVLGAALGSALQATAAAPVTTAMGDGANLLACTLSPCRPSKPNFLEQLITRLLTVDLSGGYDLEGFDKYGKDFVVKRPTICQSCNSWPQFLAVLSILIAGRGSFQTAPRPPMLSKLAAKKASSKRDPRGCKRDSYSSYAADRESVAAALPRRCHECPLPSSLPLPFSMWCGAAGKRERSSTDC